MKNIIIKYWKLMLTSLFGISIFFFWDLAYPNHLLFSEQFQMFLFDTDYLIEKVSLPSGITLYIAEFLTQFYLYPLIGAIIIMLLLILLQLITWKIAKRFICNDIYYPLSFIPSIAVQLFLCDENSLLLLPIAIIITQLTSLLYLSIRKRVMRLIFMAIITPLLYWICGPAHFIFVMFTAAYEFSILYRESKIASGSLCLTCILLYGIMFPLFSGLLLQYPLSRLITNISFYRFPDSLPTSAYFSALIAAIIPLIISYLPNIKIRRVIWLVTITIAIFSMGTIIIKREYNRAEEEIMSYDQMVRNKQWNEIIRKAENNPPTYPMSVNCLNLALGITGQLSERMFDFYQNGTTGLFSGFERHFASILPTSEVFYYLGMINSAQRFTFEAMEAIPDYRKSVRCYKRLAETNIINGQYKVAERYINKLRKTLFYKDWATTAMECLNNEEKINKHKELEKLRRYRFSNDFLFDEREMDSMLGILFTHNYENKMALEYLLAYQLVQRDIAKFTNYFSLTRHSNYKYIPRSYQEALVYTWTQSHKDFNGIPWEISQYTMRNISGFANIYFSGNNVNEALRNSYEKTYWYYLLCKK